jgi:hypothetical protein
MAQFRIMRAPIAEFDSLGSRVMMCCPRVGGRKTKA